MKKYFALILCCIFLIACSNENSNAFHAKKSHLENIVFSGVDEKANQLIFQNDQLTIIVNELMNTISPTVNVNELANKKEATEIVTISKIEVDGNIYKIYGENDFYFELARIGERIVEDSEGTRYQTSANLQ